MNYAVVKNVGDKSFFDFTYEEAFIFTGKLRDCPDWIVQMVEDFSAKCKNGKLSIYVGQFIQYKETDLVIKYNSIHYGKLEKS